MIEVEVPEYGTVIVQQGDVHDVRESIPKYIPCWCTNKKHHPDARRVNAAYEPHLIGVQQFELAWEVK